MMNINAAMGVGFSAPRFGDKVSKKRKAQLGEGYNANKVTSEVDAKRILNKQKPGYSTRSVKF